MTENKKNIKSIKRIAIIPCRHGSKRIKYKNTRKFGYSSLLEICVDFVSELNFFDEIIVSTNSLKAIKLLKKYNNIIIHHRPKYLSNDYSKVTDLLKKILKLKSIYNFAYLFEPTSIIRDRKEVLNQIKLFENKNADSFGTCSLSSSKQEKMFNLSKSNYIKNINKKLFIKRYQNLKNNYEFNGIIYGLNVNKFLKKKSNSYNFWKIFRFD